MTSKQGSYPNEESLLEWSKRYKQTLDLTHNFIGKSALDHYVETMSEYQAAAYPPNHAEAAALKALDPTMQAHLEWKDSKQQKKLKDDHWQAFTAYLFIHGCDQTKYGSFTKNLQAQFSLGNDQHPQDPNRGS